MTYIKAASKYKQNPAGLLTILLQLGILLVDTILSEIAGFKHKHLTIIRADVNN